MNTTTVKAANLKPGMVLIDPATGKAAFEIDHRVSAPRGSGQVKFFGLDYDTSRYAEILLSPKASLQVAA